MFSVYEKSGLSILAGASETVTFSGVGMDSTTARGIAYNVYCSAGGADLTMTDGGTWTVEVMMPETSIVGTIPIPVGIIWDDVIVSLTNNTTATVTGVKMFIGVTNEIACTSSTPVVGTAQAQLSRDMIYAVSKSNDYPIPVRSTSDASMLTIQSMPSDDYFETVAIINGFGYQSLGNIAPTTSNNRRSMTVPAISGGQHCILAPTLSPGYPSAMTEYIIDVNITGSCQIKFGSLGVSITPTSVDLELFRTQAMHMFTVVSATSAAGTMNATIYGVAISGAVLSTTTKNAQAKNIANLVNANPLTLTRAVAISDRVYLRTLLTQTTGTNTITSISTVTSTIIIDNTADTTASLALSGDIITSRRDTLTLNSYRIWVRPDMVTCYRRSPRDYSVWTHLGIQSILSNPRGCDGDLLVYNSSSVGTATAKQLNSVTMRSKKGQRHVIGRYEVSRSTTSFAVTTLMGFLKATSMTSIYLKSISVENTANNPAVIRVVCDGTLPNTNVALTEYGSGNFVVTSALQATIIAGGNTIFSEIINPNVTNLELNLWVAPSCMYTIVVDQDPATTAKTGRIGIIAVFEEIT